MPSFPFRFSALKHLAIAIVVFAVCLDVAGARTHSTPQRSRLQPSVTHGLIVGYFGQGSVYDHFYVKNLVTSGAAAQLDQINYSQGFVTGGRCSVADPNADLNFNFTAQDSVDGKADSPATPFHGNFHQIAELKRIHPGLKVLISLEGRAADFAADAQPAARAAFVASCIDIFIRGHLTASPNVASGTPDQPSLFDGIDVDWEYPGAGDAGNFLALLTELREAMDAVRPGLRLSIAVGPSPHMYPGVDMGEVSHIVDQIGIMNYDYTGPWSQTTGFLAPLYTEDGHGGSVERSILDFKEAGVPPSRLLMGLPFYGYGWKAVGESGAGLFQRGQSIRGDRPYSYLQTLLLPVPQTGPGLTSPTQLPESSASPDQPSSPPSAPSPRTYVLHRDPRSHAPWLYDGDTFWTYEDPISIGYKTSFAAEQQLGGIMAWELSQDAPDAALLKAARSNFDKVHSTP